MQPRGGGKFHRPAHARTRGPEGWNSREKERRDCFRFVHAIIAVAQVQMRRALGAAQEAQRMKLRMAFAADAPFLRRQDGGKDAVKRNPAKCAYGLGAATNGRDPQPRSR